MLALVAGLATVAPTARALRVDPAVALRHDRRAGGSLARRSGTRVPASPARRLYVDRLWPNLLQSDFAALMRQDQLHSLDQVAAKGLFFAAAFLGIAHQCIPQSGISVVMDEGWRRYFGCGVML